MIETKTIPVDAELLPTSSLNQNYSLYEFPSRACLVCGKTEKENARIVYSDGAWLCDRCRSTLLKLINDFNATSNASNALNALEQENKEGKEEVTDRNVGRWMHKEITADFHAVGQCSVCKERRRLDNFCSNCGADMRGREDD